jgi:2-methylcitrate dehydratase PrpD
VQSVENDASSRPAERVATAIDLLAGRAAAIRYDDLPTAVRDRLQLMLTDLFGVTIAGIRTPELEALIGAWRAPPGDRPVPGTAIRTDPETSAYLSAVAACVLELDEGNKYAAGHPAAHVVFAAVAAADLSAVEVPGPRFLAAVAAGYEVAARFGRATRRDPRWHTHGHWGVTGAAAASALLLGGGPAQVAAAIDASTALMQVTPWATVLSGDFTRNLWMAGANLAGLNAARLAVAGLVENAGNAQHSLGSIVGALDPAVLVADLDSRWLGAEGYLKRHASCSYTHAAVDIVQSLHAARPWQPTDVSEVRVLTSSLARPLLARHPRNRLAAMFSLPFVVSCAVVNGRVDPATMQPATEPFLAAERFSERVRVEVSEELDAYLPGLRCTEVTVELTDGTSIGLGQPNPIGDVDHFPLSRREVRAKLDALIGAPDAALVEDVVACLTRTGPAAEALRRLGCG